MTGNIIANTGFVKVCTPCSFSSLGLQLKVYGTQYNSKGTLILAADILAAWGGIQSAGQGFAMISMNL